MKKVMIIGLAAAGIFMQGCASVVLPSTLNKKQMNIIQQSHIPLSVAVDTRKSFSFDRLICDMQKSHLFERVDTLDKLPDADIIVVFNASCSSDGGFIPFWPLISFGVIPEIYTDKYGLSMRFKKNPASRRRGPTVDVKYGYSSTTILGWICLPLNLLPDRYDASCQYYETERFNRQIVYAIANKKNDLMKLYATRN